MVAVRKRTVKWLCRIYVFRYTSSRLSGWNDRRHPFVWTKTADDILKKANRQTTSNTDH
jgi:hypothetical protein